MTSPGRYIPLSATLDGLLFRYEPDTGSFTSALFAGNPTKCPLCSNNVCIYIWRRGDMGGLFAEARQSAEKSRVVGPGDGRIMKDLFREE